MVEQDRHQLDGGLHPAEDGIEPLERPIGVRRAAERGEQRRGELGQDLRGRGR